MMVSSAVTIKSMSSLNIYKILISVGGLALVAWSLGTLDYHDISMLLLLATLGAITQIVTTFFQTSDKEVVYEVGSAVAMAAVPQYGAQGAITIITVLSIGFWVKNRIHKPDHSERFYLLLFNLGLQGIAIYLAILFYDVLSPFHASMAYGFIWIGTALIYDQANFALLSLTFQLRYPEKFKPLQFWRENMWAMCINIAIMSMGGGVVAYAATTLGWVGVIIFFLPIGLSGFAFRLYANRMQALIAIQEETIAQRTNDLQQANANLRQANLQLSEADAARDRYLAVLSHDMRTPISGIVLYSELLERMANASAEKRTKMMRSIQQNADVLAELVDNLVVTEEMKLNQPVIHRELFDLVPLLEQATESFMPQAASKSLALKLQIESDAAVVYADKGLIKRAIRNLISNAIKYTLSTGRVTVYLSTNNEAVQIVVHDTGVGIPTDQISQIFAPYYRVEGHKRVAQGTGLGLHIVKNYVEAHGGEITVTSVVGRGSRFEISLPLSSTHGL